MLEHLLEHKITREKEQNLPYSNILWCKNTLTNTQEKLNPQPHVKLPIRSCLKTGLALHIY